ncbi:MAG: LysM peptidoglycan-binding domain-containing protein, partial [Bacteroidia bacterium]|nr:LysM peptidoglycan-binding domain-containing protein [Bacteroidia bacterium]
MSPVRVAHQRPLPRPNTFFGGGSLWKSNPYPKAFAARYNAAPPGSMLEVSSPETGSLVYAEVVEALPPDADVALELSVSAWQRLLKNSPASRLTVTIKHQIPGDSESYWVDPIAQSKVLGLVLTHPIRPGETMASIAQQYGVRVDDIR